ncbi:MAG TPA: helix-turn-helix transcriptional regulator [Ignavibacteriaceae bacterium]|nr:helix-turn-helix transcriptional regulator [Ignavibacteriaceae bacterium]
MKARNTILLPRAQKTLIVLGENIKLARLRRKFSSEQVSERAGISRPTLVSIEKGSPNVTIGAYVKVLAVLGLEKDIMEVAKDDSLGRRLQDAKLIVRERAPRISKNVTLQSNQKDSKMDEKGKVEILKKSDGSKK